MADSVWNRRHTYDGPPQWTAEERIERMFHPCRMEMMNRFGGIQATGKPEGFVFAKEAIMAKKATLTERVDSLTEAVSGIVTLLQQQAAAPAPAPATAGKPARTAKPSPAKVEAVPPAHPVENGSFSIQLTKFRQTANSVVYKELVNGKAIEEYSDGFVGDLHIRAEALAAAGKLKKSGRKADGPETIEITVNLG